MGQGQLSLQVVDLKGLTVGKVGAAGGAVAGVGNRQLPRGKPLHHVAGKHLAHQAQPFMAGEHAVVVDDDSAALLPAVLQGVQAVIGQTRHILLALAVDAEHAAFFVNTHGYSPRLAFTNPRNSGWGLLGRLLNSG